MERFKSYQDLRNYLHEGGEQIIASSALTMGLQELLLEDYPDDLIPDYDEDMEDDMEAETLLAIGAGVYKPIY